MKRFNFFFLFTVDYTEWEALKVLKKEILKDVCVHHSNIMKAGIRGEAEVRRYVRNHINYYDSKSQLRIVRIDLLKCEVKFINSDNIVTGKSNFYLAEGSSANHTFKLIRIKKSFYLVGEIHSDMWATWMSKQNMRSVDEEIDAEIEERLSEEIQEVYLRGDQEKRPQEQTKEEFQQTMETTMQEIPKEITPEVDDQIRKENLEKVRKATKKKEDGETEILEKSHEEPEKKAQENIQNAYEGKEVLQEETQARVSEKIQKNTVHGEIQEQSKEDIKIDVQLEGQPDSEDLREKTPPEKSEETKKKKNAAGLMKYLCRKPTVKD
jgi:hypothetical protein